MDYLEYPNTMNTGSDEISDFLKYWIMFNTRLPEIPGCLRPQTTLNIWLSWLIDSQKYEYPSYWYTVKTQTSWIPNHLKCKYLKYQFDLNTRFAEIPNYLECQIIFNTFFLEYYYLNYLNIRTTWKLQIPNSSEYKNIWTIWKSSILGYLKYRNPQDTSIRREPFYPKQ